MLVPCVLIRGWKIINPSGVYPRISSDFLLMIVKRGPITIKFTRGPRNFLHFIFCMYYGKIIELLCVLYIRRISNGLIYIFLASVLAPEFELEGYMVKIQLLIRIGNFGTRSRIKKKRGTYIFVHFSHDLQDCFLQITNCIPHL